MPISKMYDSVFNHNVISIHLDLTVIILINYYSKELDFNWLEPQIIKKKKQISKAF